MIALIQLQCIFSYTIQTNPELEPHAPTTYQSKLVPGDSINKCEFGVLQYLPPTTFTHRVNAILVVGEFPCHFLG